MRNWTLLGEAPIPGTGKSLSLYRGKDDFFIKLTGKAGSGFAGAQELMNSRKHGSEDALGALPCARIGNPGDARVLVGGLGMGFTLAAVLQAVGPDAEVTVAELIPEVVEWNRGPLGERSGWPLQDPRTRVYLGDVAKLLRRSPAAFDVIALDVDNGPEGLTRDSNDWLYTMAGIDCARRALRPGGVLAYWSASADRDFSDTLRRCGLRVEEVRVYAHGNKGARHTLWLATDSD
jgi:spermidine synthase